MSVEKSLASKKAKKSKAKKPAVKKGKRIAHTHIEHGQDGSHVIRHQFDQGDLGEGEAPTPDAVHGVSDSDGLLSHMQDQFGGQLPGPESAGQGAPAAPAQGTQV